MCLVKDLFRKAYKYCLLDEQNGGTSVDIKTGNANADKVLNVYKNISNRVPFPLNSIEEDIKYCAIADGIRSQLPSIEIWVDKGICVELNKEAKTAVRISRSQYQVFEYSNKNDKDIVEYMNTNMFKQFNWLAERLRQTKSVKDFYTVFMKKEILSVKKNKGKFEDKLLNMLQEEEVPILMKPRANTVIDGDDMYTLDIFKVEYETGNQLEEVEIRDRQVVTRKVNEVKSYYDYTTFIKNGNSKMKEIDCISIGAIFEIIVSREEILGRLNFAGIVINGTLFFKYGGTIFKSSFGEYNEPEIVAEGARIYGFTDKAAYLIQTDKFEEVNRDTIYKLDNNGITICDERLYR